MRPSFRRLVMALTISTAAVVAACGNATVVSHVYRPFSQGYGYEEISYAASLGPIPVFVRGSPFAQDGDNSGVAAAVQRYVSVPNLRFVGTTAPGRTGYRLVLAFGRFMPGVNYCDGSADFPVSSSDSGEVAATFCRFGQTYSQALVRGGPSRDPSDPNFVAMMNALSLELFR